MYNYILRHCCLCLNTIPISVDNGVIRKMIIPTRSGNKSERDNGCLIVFATMLNVTQYHDSSSVHDPSKNMLTIMHKEKSHFLVAPNTKIFFARLLLNPFGKIFNTCTNWNTLLQYDYKIKSSRFAVLVKTQTSLLSSQRCLIKTQWSQQYILCILYSIYSIYILAIYRLIFL